MGRGWRAKDGRERPRRVPGVRARLAVLALAGGAVIVACNSDVAEWSPATTTVAMSSTSAATSPPTTPPPPTDEEQILAAYQGYWDTWLAANDPPDPAHPDLDRYYTGVSLERARRSIADNAERGRVLRLPSGSRYEHRAAVRSIDGDRAVVDDCAIDDGHVIDAATGEVLDAEVVTERLRAELVLTLGHWLVIDVELIGEWDGAVSCDMA